MTVYLRELIEEKDQIGLVKIEFKSLADKNNNLIKGIMLVKNGKFHHLDLFTSDEEYLNKILKQNYKDLTKFKKFLNFDLLYNQDNLLKSLPKVIRINKNTITGYLLKQIKKGLKPKLILTVDKNNDMVELKDVNNENYNLAFGNEWDFHSGCTPLILPERHYDNLDEFISDLNKICKYLNLGRIKKIFEKIEV